MSTEYINKLLFAMIGNKELVNAWWTTPNKAFGGMKPIYIDLKQVREYLEGQAYGQ